MSATCVGHGLQRRREGGGDENLVGHMLCFFLLPLRM